MVPPRGIEPRSDALQATAMTTSAKAAFNHIEAHWSLGVYVISRPAGSSTFNSPLNFVQSPTQCASIWFQSLNWFHIIFCVLDDGPQASDIRMRSPLSLAYF